MQGTNKHIKNKLIGTLQIILALVALLGAIALYNAHKNAQRAEYAERNGCKWVIYSGYELCK